MLRALVALLLVANLAYFAWTQGHLGNLGLQPQQTGEPQRLAQQVKPEAIRLLNGPKAEAPAPEQTPVAADTQAAAALSPAAEPTACYEATGFTPAQAELLRAELRLLNWGAEAWQLTEQRSAGRWIVYMGRYESAEQATRKKAELRALGVEYRDVNTPGLTPGLALGTYSSEEAARTALRQVEGAGVRTARVVQERPDSLSHQLRLPAITEAQREQLTGLREAMAGKALQRCP
ncbi:SPOR domain-containing protein [Hydrogenophaga sp.]|uniref:SPOR domain-containing protein n=1 Tax=Hydrogenophaga sp. TaxID=1904254 RepID=UPI0035B24A62